MWGFLLLSMVGSRMVVLCSELMIVVVLVMVECSFLMVFVSGGSVVFVLMCCVLCWVVFRVVLVVLSGFVIVVNGVRLILLFENLRFVRLKLVVMLSRGDSVFCEMLLVILVILFIVWKFGLSYGIVLKIC